MYDSAAYRANPASQIARSAKWAAKNKEMVAFNKRIWGQKNKWKYAAIFARKKAERISGVAGWANESEIRKIYELSFIKTKETGIKHNVDHIVPLRSDLVCGLHCEANLQIITAFDNQSKRNYRWPDMPV